MLRLFSSLALFALPATAQDYTGAARGSDLRADLLSAIRPHATRLMC